MQGELNEQLTVKYQKHFISRSTIPIREPQYRARMILRIIFLSGILR